MESQPQAVAEQLHQWFLSILHLTDESLFSIVPEGPHRDARGVGCYELVLDVLKRNARILSQSGLDSAGKLYASLCFFLAAGCRKLGASLGVGHWLAAVDNVIHLQQQIVGTRAESEAVGLEIGSPAVLFKQQFDEAITQSSLAGGTSFLNKEDRQVALGLAINWGMRLLLAYALECDSAMTGSDRKDLALVAHVLEPLLGTTTAP